MQIGLGILFIPSVFDVIGMVPGILILMIVAAIKTWSNYVVGVFKIQHPEV